MKLFTYIMLFLAPQLSAKPYKKNDKYMPINENKYLWNQIKKHFLEQWHKFFKTYHYGPDLSQLNKIKNNTLRSDVHKILCSPVHFYQNPNVEYYITQTSKKIFGLLWFNSGTIVRIEYKNNKVQKITSIPLKKVSFPLTKNHIVKKLNRKINKIQVTL